MVVRCMKNVLLVSPRNWYLESDRVFPPLGILYLKSTLDKIGFDVDLNINLNPLNQSEYDDYDIIGFSTTTPDNLHVLEQARIIKTFSPEKVLVVGGPHATFYNEDLPIFDYIVKGYGETSFQKIGGSKIIFGDNDISGFPIPYRSKEFLGNYNYLLDGIPATTMITSRGCPFNCRFCEHANSQVYYYPIARIEEELKQVTDLGYKSIMFFDDLFAINKKRVKALCDVISKFNIIFRCFGHVLCMNDKIASMLAKAGCVETGVGFESGSQHILNTVKYPTPKITKAYEYIKTCHNNGIRVKGFFMLGLPGESSETIKATEEFIAKSGIDDFDLTIYYPYIGTAIRDNIKDYDINILDGIGYYKGVGGKTECCVSTSNLDRYELLEERNRIFKTYKKFIKEN